MPERMRTDTFLQSDGRCQFLDDMEHHDAGNIFPEPADKYKIFISRLDQSLFPVQKIVFQFRNGPRRNRYQALLVSLSLHFNKSFVQIQVGDFQVAEFRHSQSTAVQRLQNRTVALPSRVLRSICPIRASISSTVSTSGKCFPICGDSSSSHGSCSI